MSCTVTRRQNAFLFLDQDQSDYVAVNVDSQVMAESLALFAKRWIDGNDSLNQIRNKLAAFIELNTSC